MSSPLIPPPRPIRLAILEADTPVPGAHARYSGYRGVFTHLFNRALASSSSSSSQDQNQNQKQQQGQQHPLSSYLTISAHDVVNNLSDYPSLSDIDAILITGSKHSAYENDPWIVKLTEFVKKVLTEQEGEGEGDGDGDSDDGSIKQGRKKKIIKVIGVCFGHQIIGRALGQVVERNEKGWEVSVTPVGLTDVGRRLFEGREELKIQQMHRDHVVGVPDGAQLLASTDVCENQGFVIPGRVLTVQGHPEFTTDIMEELLELRKATGLFNEELFGSGMERNKVDDGVFIAQAFYKFLLQD
ncbi:class I glutamine amidotransferase-like protein [Neurospora crassa]|nr:class I glutamine amidotransferase-like protein [Neurospora crassa]